MIRSITLAVAALVALVALAQPATALVAGDPMPGGDLPLLATDGRAVTVAELTGRRGTLVLFTCVHCPFVAAWQDRMAALGNSYRKRGIGVVFINPNDPARIPLDAIAPMRAQAREHGYRFLYVVDTTSDLARAFGARHTPEAYLFDAAGHLVYHGAIDDNAHDPAAVRHRYLRDALDAVAAGRRPPVGEVPSLGCALQLRPPGRHDPAKPPGTQP